MAGESMLMKGFLVSIGFDVDEAKRKKAEAAHAATEKKITKTHQAEAAKRDKIEKEGDEKAEKRQKVKEKTVNERMQRTTKVIETGLKQVSGFALGATAAVAGLELSMVGVLAAVDRTAQGFERLAYASRRAGTTPTGMTAMGYAFSQTGSTVEAGQAFLERFGQKLQRYPGYKDALQRLLGKRIMDANGNLTESKEDLAADLGERLAKIRTSGPNGLANAYAQAGVFGADEIDANSLMDPRLRGFEQEKRAQLVQAGANPDATAANAAAFEQSMRKFQGTVDSIGTAIEDNLTTKLRPQLDALTAFLRDHDKQITEFVTKFTGDMSFMVDTFSKNQDLRDAMTAIGAGFDYLSHYLGTDDFKATIKTTADEIHALATAIRWALEKLHILQSQEGGSATDVSPGEAAGSGYGITDRAGAGAGAGGEEDRQTRARGPGRAFGEGPARGKEDPEIVDYIRKSAAAHGVDPNVAVAVARSEGLSTYIGDKGTSFGPYQLHYKNNIPGLSMGGMGDDFTRDTGLDARDPSTVKAQIDYAMSRVKQTGWTPWHGAARIGIGAREGLDYVAPPTVAAPVDPMRATGGVHRLPRLPPQAVTVAHDAEGNPVLVDAHGHSLNPDGTRATVSRHRMMTALPSLRNAAPLGITPAVEHSIDNSTTKGDTSLTHNPTYNINTTGTVDNALRAARTNAGRGWADLQRNMQGQEQ